MSTNETLTIIAERSLTEQERQLDFAVEVPKLAAVDAPEPDLDIPPAA